MNAPARDNTGLEAYLDVEERDSRRIDRGNLAKLVGYIVRHPKPLLGGFVVMIFGIGATLLEPRLFGYAIDEAIVPGDWVRLKQIAVVFLGLIFVRVGSVIAQGYLFENLGQRVTQDLRCELFSHLQRQPIAVFDRNPAGRLLTRVTNDVASLSEMFSAGFVSIVSNALMVIGILAWLLLLDFRLGLITATVFPFLVVACVYFSGRLRIAYREARSKLSALNAFLAENFIGMRVVQLFNRQKLHLARFDRVNEWYAEAQMGSVKVFALFQPSITFAAGISMALVIWFGGIQVAEGSLKLGVLVAYFAYVLSLFQPLRELADKWNVFLSGMASAERIFSVLKWTPEPKENAVVPTGVRGHIVFENVWFAYEDERWVLRDFSLEISPGMRVGVVGHTGAGKTTLISLLMRFYEPQRGRILLDGKDLREYDRQALRAIFGIVQQDVFLFSGSMEENIGFWSEAGVPPAVRETIGRLGYSRWLEHGAPVAGERGANLSMGERQVLAFARALASNPAMWILDEATANLDSDSELRIQEALNRAAQGRTRLLIAHRLSTVRDADLIVVLHKGALVERGDHAELIASNGLYARMYRYQRAASYIQTV